MLYLYYSLSETSNNMKTKPLLNYSFFISITVIVFFTLLNFSCKKDIEIKDQAQPLIKDKISGNCQKGPFVNGSNITIYELDSTFTQTGKNYISQIQDNSGSFELSNLTLVTNYAKIKCDGYYFNEVSNSNSLSSLSLYAMSDLSNKATLNINLMTTLEVSRIEYLIKYGSSFYDAKKQAQKEILNIFSIHKDTISESELLDISKSGDDNAILLAVSVILQGYRTEAELTQLLGDIATDFRTDGVLNSTALGSELINDAKLLRQDLIRSNIETKYQSLGISATIANFEKYLNLFIDSTEYIFTKNIEYPTVIDNRINLLADSLQTIPNQTTFSFGAYLPKGTALKVSVESTPPTSYGIFIMENNGWECNAWSSNQTLTATGSGQTINIPIETSGSPSTIIFYIYENNSATPTKVKTINVVN